MHYKLDRGVDHVLIDEAQDTSPRQWDIVAHIISEFTSGAGARDGVMRTVFAVGDEKQSIFSFQGAAPHEFDARRRALKKKFEDAGLKFDPVSFTYSFRSGTGDPAIGRSRVSRRGDLPQHPPPITATRSHDALADAGPSLIDLWELAAAGRASRTSKAGARRSTACRRPARRCKLAKRIQAEIKSLVDSGTMTGRARRPPADCAMATCWCWCGGAATLFDAVIQALKHADIPVAGADRLKLTEHIAIIDLMNLADALLLPQDDLALAVALKSPLFGLDEDDLFKLAWQRKGSLRAGAEPARRRRRQNSRRALRRLDDCERALCASRRRLRSMPGCSAATAAAQRILQTARA